MSTMYEQLDIYKHAGSRQDRSTLLKLYNGGSLAQTFRSVSARVTQTAFNMAGFIQPGLLLEQLQKSDVDGFNDHQLFDCPEEIDPLYEQLKPLPTGDSLSFKQIFAKICDVNRTRLLSTYTISVQKVCLFSSSSTTTSWLVGSKFLMTRTDGGCSAKPKANWLALPSPFTVSSRPLIIPVHRNQTSSGHIPSARTPYTEQLF